MHASVWEASLNKWMCDKLYIIMYNMYGRFSFLNNLPWQEILKIFVPNVPVLTAIMSL